MCPEVEDHNRSSMRKSVFICENKDAGVKSERVRVAKSNILPQMLRKIRNPNYVKILSHT